MIDSLLTGLLRRPIDRLTDDEVERLMVAMSWELERRSKGQGWLTLNDAAERLGLAKGSVHHAITRGDLRARRVLPAFGRAAVVLLVHQGDVAEYRPRDYPRQRATRQEAR